MAEGETMLGGRTALVTGAGSGIGAAVVERLVASGAKVHAVDIDGGALDSLVERVGSDRVVPWVTDLSDLDAHDTLPTEIDILVNNAGIQHVSPVHEFPVEEFERIHRIMLLSPFRLAHACLPHMYAGGWGRVVNISSVHGLRASPFKSAYVSAKHGLEGLSKVIALEAGDKGVTSNCVNPAYVRTPLVERQVADQAKAHGIPESEVLEKIMLTPVSVKRLIEPSEVADLVAYLCGPSSDSITGSSFTMDGGWTAH